MLAQLSFAAQLMDAIRDIFGISEAELADLFRLRRQSTQLWRTKGIPQTRQASVERCAELARAMQREIVPTRIPEIVRTKDAWLGGHTILETIAQRGPDAIYAYLHRLFSYTAT